MYSINTEAMRTAVDLILELDSTDQGSGWSPEEPLQCIRGSGGAGGRGLAPWKIQTS